MCEVASMVHKLFDKKSAFHKGEEIYCKNHELQKPFIGEFKKYYILRKIRSIESFYSFVLLIKPRIFNRSIDSSFLNIFSFVQITLMANNIKN